MLERYWAFSERKKNQINGLIKEWHYLLRLRILKKEKDLLICEDVIGGRDRMGSSV